MNLFIVQLIFHVKKVCLCCNCFSSVFLTARGDPFSVSRQFEYTGVCNFAFKAQNTVMKVRFTFLGCRLAVVAL